MDRVMNMDEARALVADRELWPRIRNFLWDFAPQIEPSWLGDVPGVKDAADICANPRVKAHILSSLGVESVSYDFAQSDISRLCLLDGATLLEICKWLGALSCAESLRRITDGKTVKAMKAALAGVYPEVFNFAMYFRGLGTCEAKSADDVVSAGFTFFSICIKDLPAALKLRLRLKLPKDITAGEMKIDAPAAVLKKLLKLKFTEAYKLCCS